MSAGRIITVIGEYPPLVALAHWHSVLAAVFALANRMVRHVPIVDDKMRLVGIYSIRDLLDFIGGATWEKLRSKYGDDLLGALTGVHLEEVMVRDVVSVKFGSFTLRDVIELMSSRNIGAIPVVTPEGKLVGIVSEEMIARIVGFVSVGAVAADIMSAPVYTLPLNASLARAVRLMAEKRIRHVPLVDERGVPKYMLSARDIMRFLALEDTLERLHEEGYKMLERIEAWRLASRLLVAVDPETPVNRVAALMGMHGISSVLVMEGDELKGIITDRDFVVKMPKRLGEILYEALEPAMPSIRV